MIALWYGILAFMLTTYIVLDGRNFGVGILHWIVARDQNERRQVIAAIGPLWSWHEVWLVGTGGVMVMAFPRLMAASFSGCYLALFLILWCVLLRGISIEVRGHLGDRLWQQFWDAVFVSSNVLLAALFPVMLFSTTDPARRLTAADCAAPDASLIIGTAWWFPALILAFGYLYVIQRHYSGKVNVSKDDQGLY